MRTSALNTAFITLAAFLSGCNAPMTSAYTAADMEIAVDDVRDQLASSRFISSRDADSEPLVLVPTKMSNESNERLSRVDQWMAMSRVFLNPAVLELLRSKNISVVLPPDGERIKNAYTEEGSGAGFQYIDITSRSAPTHVINATFSSITRAADDDGMNDISDTRKDLFLIDYTIVDLSTRGIVWAGSNEFSRTAHGVLAN